MPKGLTSLGRIIKAGLVNFKRNSLLSTATILVLSLNLLMIGGIVIFSVATEALIKNLEDKIDVSVYFKGDVPDSQITSIQATLTDLPEIKTISFTSKDDALEAFKKKHEAEPVILDSLKELDLNPLESSLNIKAKSQADYPAILEKLNTPELQSVIDTVNYYENQTIIDKLSGIITDARQSRLVLSIILSIISILITFITIKLAINNSREEISVMRLVGATNWSIRGPFLVEGIIYGVTSAVISVFIIYFVINYNLANYLFGSTIFNYYSEINLFYYFKTKIVQIFLILSGTGIVLSTLSSIIAIRTYLKV